MGSSLEICFKLEEGDCSFPERERFRSMQILSCCKVSVSQGTIPAFQLSHHGANKGLRMCRQLVSLGDDSDSGKYPVRTSAGANFLSLRVNDPMMDPLPPFPLPASSFPSLAHQGLPNGTPQLFCKNRSYFTVDSPKHKQAVHSGFICLW